MKNKNALKTILDVLFSIKTTIITLIILGLGAAVATFIENDFGTSTARVLVYNHIWYESVMLIALINLCGVIIKRKMWKQHGKFIFHASFVFILLGALMTRYIGYEGIMHISEGETQNNMISLEPYFQVTVEDGNKKYYFETKKEFSAIGNNYFNHDVLFGDKKLNFKLEKYTFAKKNENTMNLIATKIAIDDESYVVKLVGQRGGLGITRDIKFKNNIKVKISYGSKPIKLPFAIKLNDFQLDRYPGSMSPSSYASEVTLIDSKKSKNINYRIFMNSTLQYDGYQFFQSSYDPDEKGTVLSVNKDPGVIPTYIGYFLLTLGLILNMFDKKSRFQKLLKQINKFNSISLIILLFYMVHTNLNAQDTNDTVNINENIIQTTLHYDPVEYLKDFKINSLKTAKKFSRLIVQSSSGRMQPIDSLNIDIVNKLTTKNEFLGMNQNQIILGMLSNPQIWRNIKMIKIKTPKLKRFLKIDTKRNYVSFSEMFINNSKYKLHELINEANAMNPNLRGTFEKDIIQLDERLNIAYMVFHGNLFKIFPKPNYDNNTTNNYKWYNPIEAMKNFEGEDNKVITLMITGFIDSVIENDYIHANKYLGLIDQFQQKVGDKIVPSKNIVNSEILFNKLSIFFKLTLAYIIMGFILFFLSFMTIFNQKFDSIKLNKLIYLILLILFILHTLGLLHRWYISGHAPWSDTYESLVYISWSVMLAGVIFFKKSLMALSATAVMAAVFMFTAHLTEVNPQITNLVPVLKSYWLTIHVSIITGSYGFLAVGSMLGLMSLILFMFRSNTKLHIDRHIKHITSINEASLILGLAALIVGNFLGGIWANESWGRYWGWDPKETWAYVAIITYAIVLHLRLIPKLNNQFIFSVTSTLAFSTILMTYFGVNFYLSGMHSYATGDPVPIPFWVYALTITIFIIIFIASFKRNLNDNKEHI